MRKFFLANITRRLGELIITFLENHKLSIIIIYNNIYNNESCSEDKIFVVLHQLTKVGCEMGFILIIKPFLLTL